MRSRFTLVGFSCLVLLISVAAVPGGWAQNISGIFLTPVANAPFSGVIVVERNTVPRNGGPVLNLKTIREVARDSQGRVHNVFRALIPATDNSTPPIIRIHIYDPQTRSYTYLYPQRKTYMTGTVNHPPAAEPADLIASPAGNSVPLNQFTKTGRSRHPQHRRSLGAWRSRDTDHPCRERQYGERNRADRRVLVLR